MLHDEPLATAVAAALVAAQADLFASAGEDPMSPQAVAGEIAAGLLAGVHGVEAAVAARRADPETFLALSRALAFAPLREDVEAMRSLLVRYGWTEPGSPEADGYERASGAGLLSEIF